MEPMTNGMSENEIIEFAKSRTEVVWQWGINLQKEKENISKIAEYCGLIVLWDEPIKKGDLYLTKHNSDLKFLTCYCLGDGCVHSVELAYPFDFSECVKVKIKTIDNKDTKNE